MHQPELNSKRVKMLMGRESPFDPGPLVGTIFTNRSLGRHTRPINLMGWAIPPKVAPQLLYFDRYDKI